MARSAHPVDKVVEYFRDAPIEAAETTLRIVTAGVKQRRVGLTPAAAPVVSARRGRKPGSKNAKPVGRPSAAQEVPEHVTHYPAQS